MVIMGSPLWTLVAQSDGMTWFILLLLLAMSVCSWTIALQKFFVFRGLLAEAAAEMRRLTRLSTYEEMRAVMSHTPFQGLVQAADDTLRLQQRADHWAYDDIQLLRDACAVPALQAVEDASAYSMVLRVIAEAAPLLGLLGTIWGLIHSFVRISAEQSADIVTVAPGIAEALITTLMGLFVAIPALFFFHAVQNAAARYEELLYHIALQLERGVLSKRGL